MRTLKRTLFLEKRPFGGGVGGGVFRDSGLGAGDVDSKYLTQTLQ